MSQLVSVIMPAYNAASFIGEAIRSVQTQTHIQWEIIVVDDASNDDTAEIVRGFAHDDPRIHLYQFPRHTGLAAAARNAAMKRACGSYFAFLDADDIWQPAKLEKQLQILELNPSASVVCTWYDVFGDPERARRWKEMLWRFDSGIVPVEQVLQQSLTTPTVMMRRKCFDEIGGFTVSRRLTTGEDSEYWIRLAARYEIRRICQPLTRVRVHAAGGSLSTTNLKEKDQRDRELFRRVIASGVLSTQQRRLYTAITYYNRARDSLFHLNRPFRSDLYRSVATMNAPPKALVMAALSFLPAPLLRVILKLLLKVSQPLSPSGDNSPVEGSTPSPRKTGPVVPPAREPQPPGQQGPVAFGMSFVILTIFCGVAVVICLFSLNSGFPYAVVAIALAFGVATMNKKNNEENSSQLIRRALIYVGVACAIVIGIIFILVSIANSHNM